MTSAAATQKDRKGEILIQDGIQRTIEAQLGGQKVLLWSRPKHGWLRDDPLSPTGETRSQVIMEDLLTTSDGAYGKTESENRKSIQVNVMGLVSAIEQVNRSAFTEWLTAHPTANQTVRGLAELAAVHLADLFEKPPLGVNVSSWRMMLALGEKQAWENVGKRLGAPDGNADPRVLTNIPGAPAGASPLHYQPCWPARNNVATFLDDALRPGWLDCVGDMMGSKRPAKDVLEGLKAEYAAEAARRRALARSPAPQPDPSSKPNQAAPGSAVAWERQVNQHYWIREYHTPVGGVDEYPDFVLFINGLPLLWVEVKPRETGSGIEKGIDDFQSKPSYQGAALAVVTDGDRAIVDARMVGEMPLWVNYEGNLTDGKAWKQGDPVTHGSGYLFEQLLSRPARAEFFLRHCGAFNQYGHYMTARSQQYQALAHLARDLEWLDVCRAVHSKHGLEAPTLGNRLVQHTQRTGKTLTMVRSIHLAQGYFPELFRMSMLMVGEVDILKQILTDITENNFGLADQALDVCRAESKQGLKNLLKNQADGMKQSRNLVILANMQKIDSQIDYRKVRALPNSKNVLVVLDEGHLAQTEKAAKARQGLLPDASNLLFTATPKSAMNEHYGLIHPWHRLDVFGFGVAQEAGIVCPVIYRRHPYSFEGNHVRIGALVDAMAPALTGGLDLKKETLAAMIVQVLNGQGSDGEEAGPLGSTIANAAGHASNAQALVMARQLAVQIRRQIEKELIQERLDAIVDELERYEFALPRKDKSQTDDHEKVGQLTALRVFRPRSLVFARNVQSAMDIIEFIRELNKGKPTSEQNVYRGRRFAMDVANFGKDPTLATQVASTATQRGHQQAGATPAGLFTSKDFRGVNPGISDEKELKKRLRSNEPDKRVDVLLAVGKYTKGYDNDLLAVVALLRNVAEPSLINQIYTRPATKRDGKHTGVCLDLAFGLGNVSCWRQSLKMFDQSPDREQLYDEDDAKLLIEKVHLALEKTAGALDMRVEELAQVELFKERFEELKGEEYKEHRRQFIVLARKTASLIQRLPDSNLYMDIRKPLRGLRDALLHVQQVFPELFDKRVDKDSDDDGSDDGFVIQGGHSPQALGNFIRNALEALAHPSLSNIFGPMDGRQRNTLTGLLGIGMGEAVEIAANVNHTQGLTNAQERQVLRAAERVLDSVIGIDSLPADKHKDDKGNDSDFHAPSGKVKRDLRGVSALTEALNRALDRIRDDLDQLDQPGRPRRKAHDILQPSKEAAHRIRQWRSEADAQGGVLQALVYHHLQTIVGERLQQAGRMEALDNEDLDGVVQALLTEASEHISSSFGKWLDRLPSKQHDSPTEQIAQSWLHSQGNRKLSDFLAGAKGRTDIHQLDCESWVATLINSQADLKVVLGAGDSTEEEKTNPLAAALSWALTTDANQQAMERFVSQLDAHGSNGGRKPEGQATQ